MSAAEDMADVIHREAVADAVEKARFVAEAFGGSLDCYPDELLQLVAEAAHLATVQTLIRHGVIPTHA